MNKCRRCGAQFDGTDTCPGCGASDYTVLGEEVKTEDSTVTAPPVIEAEPDPNYEPKHYPAHETPRAGTNDTARDSKIGEPPPNYRSEPGRSGRAPYGQSLPPMPIAYDSGAKGLAVAALVLGILSLIFFVTPSMGIILGVIAVCFGAIAKKRLPASERGMATAGFVTGLIGLILAVVFYLLILAFAIMIGQIIADGIINATSLIASVPYLPY